MKKMLFTLVSMLTIAAAANAMSYEQARNEALFLTDKMAYELNLNDAQYEAAYEINLDYLMGVTSYDGICSVQPLISTVRFIGRQVTGTSEFTFTTHVVTTSTSVVLTSMLPIAVDTAGAIMEAEAGTKDAIAIIAQ